MSCNIWTVLKAVVESKPEVGSSRNRRDGLIIISLPILTLFLSPPDTPRTKEPPIMVSWHLSTYFSYYISFQEQDLLMVVCFSTPYLYQNSLLLPWEWLLQCLILVQKKSQDSTIAGKEVKLTSPNPAHRLHLLLVFPFALLSTSLGVVGGQHKSVFPSLLGEEIEHHLELQILSCHMFHVIMMHV